MRTTGDQIARLILAAAEKARRESPPEMFTPIFAVSRVAGWTARVNEYLEHNRIFRPRAVYVGPIGKEYLAPERRATHAS